MRIRPGNAPAAVTEGGGATLAAEPIDGEGEGAEVLVASQWRLVWWRFRRHRLALISLGVVLLIYLVAVFAEFVAPAGKDTTHGAYSYVPPQLVHVGWDGGPRFYVYGYKSHFNQALLQREYVTDTSTKIPLRFFARGEEYKLWGLFKTDIHLFGPVHRGQPFFPLGADQEGRDLLSRIIYAARISMSIGLVGVSVSLLFGVVIGGVSGYFGGGVDVFIQRVIEFIMSIPALPLWLGLAAAVPPGWSTLKTYFAITIIVSLIAWTGLARVVRGRFLQLRSEDYVLAAQLDGASRRRVIFRHMLPAFTSHIIAVVTLAIPGMILAETALSFLGLGLQPPAVSWGVLLSDAQDIRTIATAPWLLLPGAAVVIAVMSLNFVGDGLRDAADPYAN